jgi:hypothetical protein
MCRFSQIQSTCAGQQELSPYGVDSVFKLGSINFNPDLYDPNGAYMQHCTSALCCMCAFAVSLEWCYLQALQASSAKPATCVVAELKPDTCTAPYICCAFGDQLYVPAAAVMITRRCQASSLLRIVSC